MNGQYDIVSGRDVVLDPTDHLLHLQDVCMSYPTADGIKPVLENIDLRVTAGELVTLVGPSGSGKSTLLRILLGQDEATSGLLYLAGEPLGFPDTRRGIVDQKSMLYPHLTVLENVLLGFELELPFFERRRRRKELIEKAESFLENAQLSEHRHKYQQQLSGGQRARAAVLQSLIKNPKILLMDESFGGLDPASRGRMQAFLLEIWEKTGITIVFVTHDLEEAVYLGSRVIAISQYYTDGRKGIALRGSRIACDLPVGKRGEGASRKSKTDPMFGEIVEHVRLAITKPTQLRHIKEFDLKHSDSFHTVTREELEAASA